MIDIYNDKTMIIIVLQVNFMSYIKYSILTFHEAATISYNVDDRTFLPLSKHKASRSRDKSITKTLVVSSIECDQFPSST